MYSATEKELESKKAVLIVDDEEINREILNNIIKDEFNVLFACDGTEALTMMREQWGKIDLVLLDVIMPGMDGREILRLRQDDLRLKQIPIIVCTSESEIEIECFKLGVNDFIKKPYTNPEIIVARIQRMIELYEDRSIIREVKRDALTNLFKPDFFKKYALKFDSKYPDLAKDMVSIHINRLNLIKELYGKEYAYNVVHDVGVYLKEYTMNIKGIVGRNTEDSFVIYCLHQEDYSKFAQDLMKYIQTKYSTTVRINMGVYPNVEPSIDKEIVIHRVERSYENNKEETSFTLAIYDEQQQAKAVFNEDLLHSFDKAIAEHQFVLYYQPKYNIQGERDVLVSAEALVRWLHPKYGLITPNDFIPLFEENGIIHKLDEYVFTNAIKQMKAWKEKYGIFLPISINLSRVDLYDPQLISEITNKVDEHDIPHEHIYLEITESAYTENTNQMMDIANNFKKKDFKIEVDDFGSGYSSLSVLTQLELDVLKIDMSFIRNLNKNPNNTTIIKMIVDVSKMLKAICIAEGVETKAQYEFLKSIGCDVVQGFYFSKPLPPDEFEILMEKEHQQRCQ